MGGRGREAPPTRFDIFEDEQAKPPVPPEHKAPVINRFITAQAILPTKVFGHSRAGLWVVMMLLTIVFGICASVFMARRKRVIV